MPTRYMHIRYLLYNRRSVYLYSNKYNWSYDGYEPYLHTAVKIETKYDDLQKKK